MQLAVFYPPTWLSALLGGGWPAWWLFGRVWRTSGSAGCSPFCSPGACSAGRRVRRARWRACADRAVSYMFGSYLTNGRSTSSTC
jgi:hypothetical protein